MKGEKGTRWTDRLSVVYLGRRPVPGRHFSIERVFSAVENHLPDGVDARTVQVPRSGIGLQSIWENIRAVRRLESDVVHVTGDVHYVVPFVSRSSLSVLTIHDLASLNRTRGWRRRVIRWLWYSVPLRRVDLVTTVSEETRRQLLAEFPSVAWKVAVIGNPLTAPFSDVEPRPSRVPGAGREPRVLTIGAGANKNLVRIAEATSRAGGTMRLVGRLDEETVDRLTGTGVSFRAVDSLTDDELLAEYLGADVLAFVSLHEGFGLPIVEAQAVGLPVVTSDQPPMSDVAAGGAVLVDPTDVVAISGAITTLAVDESLRSELRAAGLRNAHRHRPRGVAHQYAELYRSALTATRTRGEVDER